jgi:hypothetical protein
MEIVVTEPYHVGASYEGVQAEGDCSANLLGNNSQQVFPWLAYTSVVQWTEQWTSKPCVASSILARGAIEYLLSMCR